MGSAPRSPTDPVAILAVATRWGPASIAAGADGVHAVGLLALPGDLARVVSRRVGRPVVPVSDAAPEAVAVAVAAAEELARYERAGIGGHRFEGWRVPVSIVGVASWDRQILEAVRAVPWGSTVGYGELARRAGSPGAARATGGAVGRNPLGLVIPCHRVIAGDGSIGGYGGTWPADRQALIELKRALLAHEGVVLRDDPRA
jgi:methylated-DNA-[protein]-cysteine S-methyltransferase